MARERTMEEATFTNIDKGTYPITCIGVKEDTIPNPQYGNGDVIKFTLQFDTLEDDEGNLLTRETMASDYLTPGSKLTAILLAFGVTAEVGFKVDIDDCIGRQALATVGSVTKTVKGVVKTYDTIESVFPAPKTKGASRPAAEPTPTPDTDISAWWKTTRDRNWKRDEVLALSHEMYGAEPAELAPEDRIVLLEAIEQR